MASDFYGGDDEGELPAKPGMGDSDDGKGKPEEDDDANEALVPKSFLGNDLQIGKKCTIEIVHLGDEDAVVKYVDSSDSKEPESEMSRAGSKMEALATEE
jgi:hypothetical protein